MNGSLPLAVCITAALAAAGCSRADPPAPPAPELAAPPVTGPRFIAAPADGPVADAVHESLTRALADHRRLVVYVGAKWCEPCVRFHHATERGELDSQFPGVTFLEFDLDRDGDRLKTARYVSKYIPLFALPAPDGTASGKQVEGGIKGDGAVGYIAPRLQDLLAR